MQGHVRRIGLNCALAIGLLIVSAAGAAGQKSRSDTVTATFVVGSQAKLSISSTSLTFANADPDSVAQIQATEGPLAVTVACRSSQGGTIILTVQAADELRSGLATIPVSALSWTTSGTGFVGGTMSTAAQTAGSWMTAGNSNGVLTFRLRNSWTYPVGTYSTTITYTLTVP
jgi:hypothetical protein